MIAISTHTPLAGRDGGGGFGYSLFLISTHTPLAGRDDELLIDMAVRLNFNSHAPRGA